MMLRSTPVDGFHLAYAREGSGAPVVLLHGGRVIIRIGGRWLISHAAAPMWSGPIFAALGNPISTALQRGDR
jgi:hypothetical protein